MVYGNEPKDIYCYFIFAITYFLLLQNEMDNFLELFFLTIEIKQFLCYKLLYTNKYTIKDRNKYEKIIKSEF